MADTKLSQKEEAIAFAKEHGFTIGLETIDRRTYYHAERPTGRVESQGYGSLTVRMRKHLESIGEIPVKVFEKTQSRAAAEAAHVRDQPKIMPVALNWKTPDAANACPVKSFTDFKIGDEIAKDDGRQLAAYAAGIQENSVSATLLRGSNSSPVVIIFDDIQAASEDTPQQGIKFKEWQHQSNPMPRRAHYRRPSKPAWATQEWDKRRPWAVYASGDSQYLYRFGTRSEAVTCVRRLLSSDALIKASVGAMEIKFERG